MWSTCRYNVLKVTQIQMLLLGFMNGIGFNLMYGGRMMVTMTVF